MPLPNSTFTVAEAARMAGYATIHTGKWYVARSHLLIHLARDELIV
jgi:arylsulfatase A-like enzyme